MGISLGRTDCRFCSGEVLLDEEPRTAIHLRRLLPEHLHDALIAEATCVECRAEYVAWFDADMLNGLPRSSTSFFKDLSHRSTMSNEPGEPDLPMYTIDSIRIRRTWPMCLTCGKHIFGRLGCQCSEPQPLRVVVRPKLVIPEWRSMEFAITTYDLFVSPPAPDEGDQHAWTALRTLIENAYLENLEKEVRVAEKDRADHYIEVSLLPAGLYRGDDRNYHRAMEELVNRASLIVEAETLMDKLGPETPIDGEAGPWVSPKRRRNMMPHRDEYHWLAAFAWAYSDLPHHLIHVMQEQVRAYRESKQESQSDRWWVSLGDDKLVRPVAHFERDLPLGMQIGDLYVADGGALVAEDKRLPRRILATRAIEIDDDEVTPPPPPAPAYDNANWPATSMVGSYPNVPNRTPAAPMNTDGFIKQYPNP